MAPSIKTVKRATRGKRVRRTKTVDPQGAFSGKRTNSKIGYLEGGKGGGSRPQANSMRKAASRRAKPQAKKGSGAFTRTAARLAATGPVKGVNSADGFTKGEQRKVRQARRRQKYNRNVKRYFASKT